jgi:hypothetical protein
MNGDPEELVVSNSGSTCSLLMNTQTPGGIHLTEVGHHALPWASRRTITLDQRPVAMALAILVAIAATQVHASILRMATPLSRGLVFTTKTISQDTQYFLRTPTEHRKVNKSLDSNYSENVLKNISNHLRLRKVG